MILEAMACGLPVVTTTSSAGPDIITNGHDGWVIEPNNVPHLVKTMQGCLEQSSQIASMGMHARNTAERFSWPAYGKRLLTILQELVGDKA